MKNNESIKALFQRYLENEYSMEDFRQLQEYFQVDENRMELTRLIRNQLSSLENASDESTVANIVQKVKKKLHAEISEQRSGSEISDARIQSELSLHSKENHKSSIETRLDSKFQRPTRIVWNSIGFKIAAVLLIAISIGIYLYIPKQNHNEIISLSANNDVDPGGNRATLTLADGSTINLSDNQDGIIIGTDSISYNDGSTLGSLSSSTFVIQSDSEGSLPTRQASTLTLSTPNGGQYQVTLPDGTKVWLNAASTLKYPSRFDGKDRRVELEGEAYFDVSQVSGNRLEVSGKKSNAKLPFIVISAGQEVTVLGTHFNIKAYTNEPNIKTTLIEGSVQVATLSPALSSSLSLSSRAKAKDLYKPSSATILKPNQQSTIASDNNIQVTTIDPATAIAWKNGLIRFDNADIHTLMREIVRWYDVEVVYEGKIPKDRFTGSILRAVSLSQLIQVLEWSNVKARIEGKKLIIS